MEKKLIGEDVWKRILRKNSDDCWNWVGNLNWAGYGRIRINYKMYKVHRLVYELTYGPILNGLFVLHKCNNPSCCNPNHLYLGTQKDNMEQRNNERRQAVGEKLPQSKLTEQNVLEIRQLYSTGNYTQKELGDMFIVKRECITKVINYINWKNIKEVE